MHSLGHWSQTSVETAIKAAPAAVALFGGLSVFITGAKIASKIASGEYKNKICQTRLRTKK